MEHKNKKEEKGNSNKPEQKTQAAQTKKGGVSKDQTSKPTNKSGGESQKKK
ncbi:hypothetical protein [Planktosalinus lacus]|uniref:Uncharacterized protein n=1 Tax=Planktosalinus lacus TaxID=1526573 RepID=A0A8J2YB65_9FLAO|nr:hypothetical protein [Planktosalinus lacus]GGD96820.1 hypothetical protein GCM10011312_20440 [Planktosalinus lacus]